VRILIAGCRDVQALVVLDGVVMMVVILDELYVVVVTVAAQA